MKIANNIASKILNQQYTNQIKLPSEIDLAKEYNTSKMTIRRALSVLVDSGIVFPIPKSGYVINKLEDIRKFNSLTGNSITFLNKGAELVSKVVSFELIDTPADIQSKFNTELTQVILLKRLRYLDNVLAAIEITYLNANLFTDLTSEIAEHSVYEYVQNKNYNIAANLKTLRANFIPEEFLKYDSSLKNRPFIEIENIGYLTNGTVFEYSISYNRDSEYSTVVKYTNILNSLSIDI